MTKARELFGRPIDIKASSVFSQFTATVRVTGIGRAKARLWIGLQLLRVAAFVAGVGLRIEKD